MCRLSSRLNQSRNPADFLAAGAAVALATGVPFATAFFAGFFVVAMMVMVNDKWWVINSILSYN